MNTTFRIITVMSDGRSSRVLTDKMLGNANLEGAKATGDLHIKPYEGGRSHIHGVVVTIYDLDGTALAWRKIDEPWRLENLPADVGELGDAQRALDDRTTL
jgi:hypothetical protein